MHLLENVTLYLFLRYILAASVLSVMYKQNGPLLDIAAEK
jgi:hypothetical protein